MNDRINLIFLCIFFSSIIVIPFHPSFSTVDFSRNYYLSAGWSKYKLTLTISESLYKAYQAKSHVVVRYEEFVTPQAFIQVANQIRKLFSGDEDFANAVLMMVHQIPYNKTTLKYPVETVVDNFGDCDVLSVLAASVMKAGGLDVVLLEYSHHMNLGVCLLNKQSGTYYNYNGKRFYVAETTGSGWRVGECPPEYTRAYVISLENCEINSPGQVNVSLTEVGSPFVPVLIITCVAMVCGLSSYIFLRWRRRTEKTISENEKLPNDVWCICPKCGAYISANIEYCPCGTKLPKRPKKRQ